MKIRRRSHPRILIVGPLPPPYHGVGVFTRMLINSKLAEMYSVFHLNTSDPRDVAGMEKLDFINLFLGARHAIELIRILFKKRPCIVYIPISQNRLAYLRDALFMFLSRLFSGRIIVHLHGGYFRLFYENSSWMMRFIITASLSCVDRAVVLGDSLRCIFKDFLPDQRIEVVPNGIEDIFFDNIWSRDNVQKNEGVQITFLSTLRKDKGIYDFVQSMQYVLPSYPSVRFKIAGAWFRPEEKIELEDFLRDHPEVQDKMDFLGPVIGKTKADLLLNTMVFVFPPISFEGQPLVLLEALSAGIPIVTTNQGCIAETIIDGENGFIVEKQNPKAIADAILYLIRNPDVRLRMGQANRERYKRLYTQDKCVERLAQVFEKVLGQSS